MNRWREIILAIIILILLIMAASKETQAKPVVTSRLIDPNTGIPIGVSGVRNLAIGPAVLPPSWSNSITDSQTVSYAKNPPIPLCPIGFQAVIDPDTSGIYCVLPAQANL